MKMCRITEVQEACRTFDVSLKKNCIKFETNFLNLSCMMRASGNSIFFPVIISTVQWYLMFALKYVLAKIFSWVP